VARPDDYSLSDSKRRLIRQHAEKALKRADAFGCFPTPIAAIMDAANVVVSEQPLIDESFLAMLRRKSHEAGKSLLRALDKVLGVLHVAARTIYLDKTIHIAKRTFLKLHETGHAVLPWQRDIFVVTEDCDKTLLPEVAEQFEREASAFAADVLFQLDAFTEEAQQSAFNILVPVKLAKRYGSSIYMAVRRYVTTHHCACAVLVLEPPILCERRGFVSNYRRFVASPEFQRQFGVLNWPDSYGPDDEIGAIVPIGGRKMSRPREISIKDRNGTRHQCLAEAFTQGHQVFILIHAVATLTRTKVILS
jgi:hypothetical protein